MTTTPPSRLSQDGDRPQGAYAGDVGRDRPARATKRVLSIGSDDSASTSPLERFEDGVVFHPVRIFGLTVAALVLGGLVVVAGLRIAAAHHPTPWQVVQIAAAEAMAGIAELLAGVSAAMFVLGLVILVVLLVVAAVSARFPQPGIRPRPEPTTGREGRE